MLPVFHLEVFRNGDEAARRAFAEELGTACETVGFFYLHEHGVPPQVIDTARAVARDFFALPEADKRAVARQAGHYRGFIPAMTFAPNPGGRPPVRYEAFIQGLEIGPDDPIVAASDGVIVPNRWPAHPAGFRAALLAYWEATTKLSEGLLRAFAFALGQPEERLLAHFRRPISNISLLHYLPRPADRSDGTDDARAHADTNALTILLPGAEGGLEVMTRAGRWVEVPPKPDHFVVNIGNMMACWSGGRFRSTLHRVHPPLGRDRYSIAYFAAPDYDTQVAPLPGLPKTGEQCEPLHAGRDLKAFIDLFDQPAEAD